MAFSLVNHTHHAAIKGARQLTEAEVTQSVENAKTAAKVTAQKVARTVVTVKEAIVGAVTSRTEGSPVSVSGGSSDVHSQSEYRWSITTDPSINHRESLSTTVANAAAQLLGKTPLVASQDNDGSHFHRVRNSISLARQSIGDTFLRSITSTNTDDEIHIIDISEQFVNGITTDCYYGPTHTPSKALFIYVEKTYDVVKRDRVTGRIVEEFSNNDLVNTITHASFRPECTVAYPDTPPEVTRAPSGKKAHSRFKLSVSSLERIKEVGDTDLTPSPTKSIKRRSIQSISLRGQIKGRDNLASSQASIQINIEYDENIEALAPFFEPISDIFGIILPDRNNDDIAPTVWYPITSDFREFETIETPEATNKYHPLSPTRPDLRPVEALTLFFHGLGMNRKEIAEELQDLPDTFLTQTIYKCGAYDLPKHGQWTLQGVEEFKRLHRKQLMEDQERDSGSSVGISGTTVGIFTSGFRETALNMKERQKAKRKLEVLACSVVQNHLYYRLTGQVLDADVFDRL